MTHPDFSLPEPPMPPSHKVVRRSEAASINHFLTLLWRQPGVQDMARRAVGFGLPPSAMFSVIRMSPHLPRPVANTMTLELREANPEDGSYCFGVRVDHAHGHPAAHTTTHITASHNPCTPPPHRVTGFETPYGVAATEQNRIMLSTSVLVATIRNLNDPNCMQMPIDPMSRVALDHLGTREVVVLEEAARFCHWARALWLQEGEPAVLPQGERLKISCGATYGKMDLEAFIVQQAYTEGTSDIPTLTGHVIITYENGEKQRIHITDHCNSPVARFYARDKAHPKWRNIALPLRERVWLLEVLTDSFGVELPEA